MKNSNDRVVDFATHVYSSWWFVCMRWRFFFLVVGIMAVASCGTGRVQLHRVVAAVRVVEVQQQLVGIGTFHGHDFQMSTVASNGNDSGSASPPIPSPLSPPPSPMVDKEPSPPPESPPHESSPPMIAQREPPPPPPPSPHHAPPPPSPHHPPPHHAPPPPSPHHPPPHHAPPPPSPHHPPASPPPHHAPPPVVHTHEPPPPPPPDSIEPRVPSAPVNVSQEPPPSAANYTSPPPNDVQSHPLPPPPSSRTSHVVSTRKLLELEPQPNTSPSSSSKCQDPFPSSVAPAPVPSGSPLQAPAPSPFFAPSYQPVPAPTSNGSGTLPAPYTPSPGSNSTVAHTTMFNQCTYTIITTTGNIDGAGTTADVNVEFFDKWGNSMLFVGLKSQNRNFQKGATDTFTLIGDCVQQICRMHLSHDDAGNDPSWFVDTVTVSLMYQTHVFNVYEWLAKNEPPYTISREISSCEP